MSNFLKFFFILNIFLQATYKAEELLPEEIGEVDYIEVLSQSSQNFEFVYYKYIDDTENYQQVFVSEILNCKPTKNPTIRYQLNNDLSQIVLEGDKIIQQEQFLIKLPLINVIKKHLILKPFCSSGVIDLYIYNFDHEIEGSLRLIKLQRLENNFKKGYFLGYQYNLINLDLQSGEIDLVNNLHKSIICKPKSDIQLKSQFKFEFFMIEGDGEITSRIKKDINPKVNINMLPAFINSHENLVPHCFLYQNNDNFKIVLRNQKSTKKGNEHEDNDLFQMILQTEGNLATGKVFKVDDDNRSTLVTTCELEVDFLNQYQTVELKYLILQAKKLYTEFSEINKVSVDAVIHDSTYIGTQYFKKYDPQHYDCKIHFTKKDSEEAIYGFMFYKEVVEDIDVYLQEEKEKLAEKVDYDQLFKQVDQHIKESIKNQIQTEEILDEQEEKLSQLEIFNDLIQEYSDEIDEERESESVQIDEDTLQAEKIKELQEVKNRSSIITAIDNQNINKKQVQQDQIKNIKVYQITEESDEHNQSIFLQKQNVDSDEQIEEKPKKLEHVKNKIDYYKRANVSSDSDDEPIKRVSLFNKKYGNPMHKVKNTDVLFRMNYQDYDNQIRKSFRNRDSIKQRSRAVEPQKKITNIQVIPLQNNDQYNQVPLDVGKLNFGTRQKIDQSIRQKQQDFYKNYLDQKQNRNSFSSDDNIQIPDENVANELRLSQVNVANRPKKVTSIHINMNDYLDHQTQSVTRDYIRSQVIKLKNDINNEKQFRMNRFKNVNRSKQKIFDAINEKVREKYQSLRRNFAQKPFMQQTHQQQMKGSFWQQQISYYQLQIKNNELVIFQRHKNLDQELSSLKCGAFLDNQVEFLEKMAEFKVNKVQFQWIHESKVFTRDLIWDQQFDELNGFWEEDQQKSQTELLLASRLHLQNQKCVYKLHKHYLEIMFVKDFINATQHVIYQQETMLHYKVIDFHTNMTIKSCQEQIMNLQQLPVISAYQTDIWGFTQESKYNLYHSSATSKTFLTQNINNEPLTLNNSFCVIDKTNYKFKKRVALRNFKIPETKRFQFVEIYFYNYQIAVFETHFNIVPQHSVVYYDFSEKLKNADLETLFYMVNTFVNQNIVSQTNLVKKGYRIRLPYLKLLPNERKREVHVEVNSSKSNNFAFIYLKPTQQNIQVLRTALFQTSNKQLNYLFVNDYNQNTFKVALNREYQENQLVHTRQINNELFYYKNLLVIKPTRQRGQQIIELHQNPIQLKEGFYMETFFIQSLPFNNRITIKDAVFNMEGSKISITQNLYQLNVI